MLLRRRRLKKKIATKILAHEEGIDTSKAATD
jgi:hypothetical protein